MTFRSQLGFAARIILAATTLCLPAVATALPCGSYPPVEVSAAGDLLLPHPARTAAQDGLLLYLGGYFGGFMVVDVADAAGPRLVTDVAYGINRLNNPTWIELGPGVGFLGGGYGEIPIFDFADPAAPQPVAEITLPFEVMATAYGDGFLYAATYGRRSFAGTDTSAISIFDVGDPTAPVAVAWLIDNHHWAYAMEYRDGVVYLGAASGLHTFDVTDPSAVIELGVIDLGAPVTGIEIAGDQLRVVDLFGTLHLIDAGDPKDLVVLAAVDLDTSKGEGLHTAGTRTYVACGAAGLVVADLAEPQAPPVAWPTASYCNGVGPAAAGGLWVLSGETILGVADDPPDPSRSAAHVNLDYLPTRAAIDGDRLYVVDGDLTIVDVADPEAPVVLGFHDDANHYSSLAVNGTTVYLGSNGAGVVAVDVADPGLTTVLGVLTTEPTYSLLAAGSRVFVGPRDGALQVIDAADPAAPVVLGTYPREGPYRTYGLDFLHDHLVDDRLVMLVGATTEILDVSDPAAITLAASLQTGAGLDVTAWGSLVLAAAGSTVKILEFFPPATLVQHSEQEVPGMIYDLAVADGAVFAACRQGGVHIYAFDEPTSLPLWADPSNPELIAVLPGHDEARCLALGDGLIAVAGNPYLETKGTIDLYPPICRIAPVEDVPAPLSLLALTASPNPFNPRVGVSFELPAPGSVVLAVYDLAGRRVRTLVARTLPAGPQRVTWDGRDDAGRAVASGSYLVRLQAGPEQALRKVTLLR